MPISVCFFPVEYVSSFCIDKCSCVLIFNTSNKNKYILSLCADILGIFHAPFNIVCANADNVFFDTDTQGMLV